MNSARKNSIYLEQRGQTIVIIVLFFLVISLTATVGIVTPILRMNSVGRALSEGNKSFFESEGVANDVAYRLIKGFEVDSVEKIELDGSRAYATTTSSQDGVEIISSGSIGGFNRKSRFNLKFGNGASFNYGVQSGEGGVVLENSSSVSGNVYSNGPIDGAGSNVIKGDVVSAGPGGLVKDIHATSSVYSHTINNSTIDKDAHYQSISGSVVLGSLYPNSPDQATSSLPISDAKISELKVDAESGGIISSPCPYRITSSLVIGPKKINCDLEISGSPIITLEGALWVSGNITIKNSPTVKVSSLLGRSSVPIIADKPSNQTGSGKIFVENSAVFEGSGTSGSYVLLISQNKSAENGGFERAIEVKNSVTGDLLVYAGHGEILLQNSIDVREVSAWRIRLKNSAEVIYETGLANLLFTGGPGGGYVLDKWNEVE